MNKTPQLSAFTNPENIRGLVFDLAVLGGNIVFSTSILDQGEDLPERTIGLLLALAICTQLLGAVLKSNPLQHRLSGRPLRPSADILDKFMGALLFFHFILFSVIYLMALNLLGMVNLA